MPPAGRLLHRRRKFDQQLRGGCRPEHARSCLGGKDTFTDIAFTDSTFYGDALGIISGTANGGNDTANIAAAVGAIAPHLTFYRDAGGNMTDHASGGNDMMTVSGLNAFNFFFGDAGGDVRPGSWWK
jgi:hypothetical protein